VLSEKPLSNLPPEQVGAYSAALQQAATAKGLVLSVSERSCRGRDNNSSCSL
jgi:hypothetical protein